MYYIKLEIKFGSMLACLDEEGNLKGLWFENQKYLPKIPVDAKWFALDDEGHGVNKKIIQATSLLFKELKAYEMGEVDSFTINIKPEGTAFQHLVWSVLKELPYGKTMTYGEISKKVAGMLQKSSMSAQAVGGAIGRNPISIIIPCHRVIGNKGQLTGYAGGLDKKRVLLIHEGCQLV